MTQENAPGPSAPGQGPAGLGAGFDLRAQARVLWAYRWLILAVVGLVLGGTALWTFRQPRLYQATCTIEYDPNPPRPLGQAVEDVAQPVVGFFQSREFFETQNRVIASRVVAEMVVRRLGLQQDPDFCGVAPEDRATWTGVPVETAAEMVRGRLLVEQIRDTRLVNIRITDASPERAQVLANAVADAYVEKTMADRAGSTTSALEWLGEQVDHLRGELEGSEQALHDFKREHNVLSVSLEDRQNLVAHEIETVSEALTQTRIQRIELQARLAALREASTTDPLSWSPLTEFETVQTLRALLRQKVVERESLTDRYGPAHPRMESLDREITEIRENLRGEVEASIRDVERELSQVRRTESGLTAALAQAHDAGLELNLREIEYSRLSRQRESNSKVYDIVLKRAAETDLTRMVRTTHVRIVDRALIPTRSVSPRVRFNIGLGGVAGLVLAILLAIGIERMDRRIRSIEDVEMLGISVLGLVPRIDGSVEPRGARRTRSRRGRAPAEGGGRDLIAHSQPMSSVAESLRTVRTNLTFMGATAGELRSMVLTSAAPREGKSTVAINLATSIAQSGKRVLLIDTDLRRPRLHRAFGVPSNVGITTLLAGGSSLAQVVRETQVPDLHILCCGPIPPNPSELLHGARFRQVLETALAQYDRVIFDSPPLGAVTDAAVLAPQVDGVVLIVKAESTTREALKHSVRQLRDVGATILGCVVNDVDLRSSRYGERYYYYRGAGYYSSKDDEAQDVEDVRSPADASAPEARQSPPPGE